VRRAGFCGLEAGAVTSPTLAARSGAPRADPAGPHAPRRGAPGKNLDGPRTIGYLEARRRHQEAAAGSSRRNLMTPPRVQVTRSYRFPAAHFYWDEALSPAENERLFGACANRHGHGHDYRLEITVHGAVDARTGMVVDLEELDRAVHEAILRHLDHRNLNREVSYFATRQPTTENLALFAWQQLAPQLAGGQLLRVRVFETDDLYAEYDGGPA
jgi:6-pyruvoyltetrahydropterin/6-carboxytetrahydropterin synthase